MLSNLLISMLLLITWNCVHTTDDINKMFNYYKEQYNWTYENEEKEHGAMKNFTVNVNKINDLNKQNTDEGTLYTINKYSDLDTDNIQEHFAVAVKPYTNVRNHEEWDALRNNKQKNLDVKILYDLDNAENLYKDYMIKFNKKNYSSKQDRLVHYYKFVKTLADINKSRFEGVELKLDENADILQEPDEYFLG